MIQHSGKFVNPQIIVEFNLLTAMFRTFAGESMLYKAAYSRCMGDCTTGSSTVHPLQKIQPAGYGT